VLPAPDDPDVAPAGPQRRCIVTGEVRERSALLRFVVGPDGSVVPLWLTPRRDIVERAVAKRAFARAARRPVAVPPELADRIESLLARRCCDALGLARRAGLAVAGFDRVDEAVRSGRAALLLFALDRTAAGRDRLGGPARSLPSAAVLKAAELGAVFGRERVVNVAVSGGTLCRRLLSDLSRLAGLRAAARVEHTTEFAPARPAPQDGGTETHD
jgi:predicted RNA-binding protein YlxR (DUF448 family)